MVDAKDTLITKQLQAIANEEVPTIMPIWNKIENDLQPDHKPKRKREDMRPSYKPLMIGLIIVIAIAVLGFFLVGSTLQTIVTDNIVIRDSALADRATVLGFTQTIDDVTVTLEWVYVDANRVSLQYTTQHAAEVIIGDTQTTLQTADGTQLRPGFGGGGGGGGGTDGIIRSTSQINYDGSDIAGSPESLNLTFTVTMGDELPNGNPTTPMSGGGGGGGGGSQPAQAQQAEPVDIPERVFTYVFSVPFNPLLDVTVEQATQNADEQEMTLSDVRISPTVASFTLCYDSGDPSWYPLLTVTVDGATSLGRVAMGLGQEDAQMCAAMNAPVNITNSVEAIEINVEALARQQQPTSELADEYEAMFAEMGIEVEIEVDEFNGYGTRLIDPVSNDPDFAEAQQTVERLLFKETQGGPWVFDLIVE